MRPGEDVPWELVDHEIKLGEYRNGPLRLYIRCRGTVTKNFLFWTKSKATTIDAWLYRYVDMDYDVPDEIVDAMFKDECSDILHTIFSSPAGQAKDLHSFLDPSNLPIYPVEIRQRGLPTYTSPVQRRRGGARDYGPAGPQHARNTNTTRKPGFLSDDEYDAGARFRPPPNTLTLTDEDRAAFPRYSAKDMELVDYDIHFGFHVLVEGLARPEVVAKLLVRDRHLQREFYCLKKITQSP